MYEEKDREQMNQDEREERKVNWTTPQKLEEGRSTDESRSRETEPLQNHPSGENASWRENTPYNNQFRQDRDFSGDSRKYEKKKKTSSGKRMIRRAAGITAAAVLFGTVSGGVMTGVNYAGSRLMNMTGIMADVQEQPQAATEAQETAPNTMPGSGNTTTVSTVTDVSAIVEKAMPSIVAITDTMTIQQRDFFGRTQAYQTQSSGSGIIVGKNDTELLIATNNHVVAGSTDLTVTFSDNKDVSAAIKGTDSATDLAIIAVKLSDIPSDTMSKIQIAAMGDSDNAKVGQQVIAIGNALGYGQSVTVGYVSALDRQITDENGIVHTYIQTDAAINPGNSGGALLNMNGEVVGINSAKLASTEVEGMGYAIAITDVSDILENLMNETPRDKVEKHGALSITGSSVSEEASAVYDIPEGVLVAEVIKDGAADKAGIEEKNIITEFDGKRVRSIEALVDMLQYYEPGEEVEVTLQVLGNGGYEEKKVTVTLDEGTSEESAASDTAAQEPSQEESILDEFGNSAEDEETYNEFFGDIW